MAGNEFAAVIVSTTRLPNSANGNPKYRLHFKDGGTATTKSDADVNYRITNSEFQDVPVVVKVDGSGRVWDVELVHKKAGA